MSTLLANVLALLAVGLVGAAILSMSARNLLLAGLCFLSASLVIYFRESKVVE